MRCIYVDYSYALQEGIESLFSLLLVSFWEPQAELCLCLPPFSSSTTDTSLLPRNLPIWPLDHTNTSEQPGTR